MPYYQTSYNVLTLKQTQITIVQLSVVFKGELKPKIDFSSFEHLGIVEQLYVKLLAE